MSQKESAGPKGMPRRIALRVIGGGVPAALAVGSTQALATQHEGHAPQPAQGDALGYAWQFFSEAERETGSVLADMILPRDDVSGSATEAGALEYIDEYAAHWGESVQIQLRGGLMWLDRECSLRFGQRFAACTEEQRHAVLEDIAYPEKLASDPASTEDADQETLASESAEARALRHGVAFFTLFRDLVAGGFYTSQIGLADLQFQGNVPFDWHGCPPHVLKKLGV